MTKRKSITKNWNNLMKKYILSIIFCIYIFKFKFWNSEKISINGNNRISEETIKVYGDIEIKKNYSEKDLNKIINNLYATEFEDVKVKLSNNVLSIDVKEYPINQIIIIGEKESLQINLKN